MSNENSAKFNIKELLHYSLARRILAILKTEDYDDPEVGGGYAEYIDNDRDRTIVMVSAKEKAGLKENLMGIGETPTWFKVPVFLISELWNDETEAHFSTPYGKLPFTVIGADDKLYFFENSYFFDSEGRAVKYERINLITKENQTLEESLVDWVDDQEEIKRIKRIDVCPKEEDSRFIPLTPEDYKEIGFILNKIESGDFVESTS